MIRLTIITFLLLFTSKIYCQVDSVYDYPYNSEITKFKKIGSNEILVAGIQEYYTIPSGKRDGKLFLSKIDLQGRIKETFVYDNGNRGPYALKELISTKDAYYIVFTDGSQFQKALYLLKVDSGFTGGAVKIIEENEIDLTNINLFCAEQADGNVIISGTNRRHVNQGANSNGDFTFIINPNFEIVKQGSFNFASPNLLTHVIYGEKGIVQFSQTGDRKRFIRICDSIGNEIVLKEIPFGFQDVYSEGESIYGLLLGLDAFDSTKQKLSAIRFDWGLSSFESFDSVNLNLSSSMNANWIRSSTSDFVIVSSGSDSSYLVGFKRNVGFTEIRTIPLPKVSSLTGDTLNWVYSNSDSTATYIGLKQASLSGHLINNRLQKLRHNASLLQLNQDRETTMASGFAKNLAYLFIQENQFVGIDELSFDLFKIYPNPTNDIIFIESSNPDLRSIELIEIFDATGRLVKWMKNVEINQPILTGVEGVCFLVIHHDKSRIMTTVITNK